MTLCHYTSYDEVWRGYFRKLYQSADKAWEEVWISVGEEIDKIVDVNVEGGTGIGGKASAGPVAISFVMKNYFEMDEHLKVAFKGRAGGAVGVPDSADIAFFSDYNYDAGKFTPILTINKELFDGELKLTFGGEVYAGIGGGGYITVNLSELGRLGYDWAKGGIVGCDSQK